MPRTLRYQVAASLDGYIAGPDGGSDWIVMDPEIDFGALLARYDAVLLGRRTWEAAARMHGRAGALFGLPTYVASRTLPSLGTGGVTLLRGDAERAVRELKNRPGREIWLFGGGGLAASLIDSQLVDVLEIATIPVVLGGGVPMVGALRDRRELKLVEQRAFRGTGTMLLTYRPA